MGRPNVVAPRSVQADVKRKRDLLVGGCEGGGGGRRRRRSRRRMLKGGGGGREIGEEKSKNGGCAK